jgi:hypothetical protein
VKRFLVGLFTLIAVVGLSVVHALPVTGQGTGGTVGPKAVGQKVLQVRLTEGTDGVHCANSTRLRVCQRQRRPPLASLAAGNFAAYEGETRVGRLHYTLIITRRPTNNRGANFGEQFIQTLVLNDGTITMQGVVVAGATSREPTSPVPSSITGGTGAYAGARGYTTEEFVRNQPRLNMTLTFIP